MRTNGRTTFALNHNPRHAIAAPQAMAIHSLERRIASWLTQDNADVVVTAWARAAQVADHQLNTFGILP
jgi:hypothetical protein